MRFGLPDEAIDKLVALLSANEKVHGVRLFGSRAKGNYRIGSDIDLCIDAPNLGLPEKFRLENAIDDLMLPWKVDLVIEQQIDNSALLDHIARVGIRLYERNQALS